MTISPSILYLLRSSGITHEHVLKLKRRERKERETMRKRPLTTHSRTILKHFSSLDLAIHTSAPSIRIPQLAALAAALKHTLELLPTPAAIALVLPARWPWPAPERAYAAGVGIVIAIYPYDVHGPLMGVKKEV